MLWAASRKDDHFSSSGRSESSVEKQRGARAAMRWPDATDAISEHPGQHRLIIVILVTVRAISAATIITQ